MKDMVFSDYFVELFQTGDFQAFCTLFRLVFHSLIDLAFQISKNQEDAEIVTLHAFKSLFRMRKTIWQYKNMIAFLYITTRQNSLESINNGNQPEIQNLETKSILGDHDKANIAELETALASQVKTSTDLLILIREITSTVPHESRLKELALVILKEAGKMPTDCGKIFHLMYGEGCNNDDIALLTEFSSKRIREAEIQAIRILKSKFNKNELFLCLLYMRWMGKYRH